MRKKIYLLIVILLLSSCGIKQESTSKKDSVNLKMKKDVSLNPKTYKGMYSKQGHSGIFHECESGKNYFVSPDGENRLFELVYKTFDSSNPDRKIFLSVEGFNSVQQSQNGIGFDTMIVITRLLGTDTTTNCEK